MQYTESCEGVWSYPTVLLMRSSYATELGVVYLRGTAAAVTATAVASGRRASRKSVM